ncbi:MAG: acyl-CoA dehydrogenase family protein [Acidimicrobiia bacterium]
MPEQPSLDRSSEVVGPRLAGLVDLHRNGATRRELRAAQYDAGLAWVWFPIGCGGLDLAPEVQDLIDETLTAAGVEPHDETSGIALAMSAPTIVAHGTDAQRQQHLKAIFTGDEVWCQLFSEPGSGSDLAGLATRAVQDGDDWVLNGQKVWTSYAHLADWALVLARHDPELPKHAGLTYFAVDMRSEGIELRGLREMTGEGQFSEVFLTDVRIPDRQRVGAVGEGWRVSLATLASERVGRGEPLGGGAINAAMEIWKQRKLTDPGQRSELMDLWVASEAYRLLGLRGYELREAGTPGPEGSLAKLASAELGQRIFSFCMNLLGAEGMLFPGGFEPEGIARGQHLAGRRPEWMFLRSLGFTIEGGTAQIQRNVIAERILGLPSDSRSERTTPWSQIPRS